MKPLVLAVLMVAHVSCAWGLDPSFRTSQYIHTAWRLQDGVFNGIPYAVTQTADGYVWLGTSSGLMRFDGDRFQSWLPSSAPSSPIDEVFSLAATADGSLWIGSAQLSRWKDDRLSTYPNISGRINAIQPDSAGGVWVARSRIRTDAGALCHVGNSGAKCFGIAEGISIAHARSVFRDLSGALWLGGSTGIATGTAGVFKSFTPAFLQTSGQLGGVAAFAAGPNGSMLVGMVRPGPNMGLQEFTSEHWSPFKRGDFDGSRLAIDALLKARDGSLWIGTFDAGLFVVRDQTVDHFSSIAGLSGDVIQAIYEDREDNIWVVTSAGLDRFRVPKVITYSHREGLSSEGTGSVLALHDGSVLVGNHDTIDQVQGGTISSLRGVRGLPEGRVTVLLEDHAGRLWVGVDDTLSVREGGRFHLISRSDGTPVGTLQRLVEDRNGDLWGVPAPSTLRLVHLHGSIVQDELLGSADTSITSIAADPGKGIWVGFHNGGIAIFRDGLLKPLASIGNSWIERLGTTPDGRLIALAGGKVFGLRDGVVQTLSSRNGLPCDKAFTFLLDTRGTLWLYTACGLIAVNDRQLQSWWKDSNLRLEYRVFDTFDGAQAAWVPFSPSASEDRDGKLWFVNGTTVQMVDPGRIAPNTVVPPVHIESVVADSRNYPTQTSALLPALTRNLEFDYAALSFVVPEKVRFRYRLEGRDPQWQDPGNRRQAFYTDLPPGQYRFHVIASNNDGVWNSTGAALEIIIPPAFYQAAWFKMSLVVVALVLIWLVYSLRLRAVTTEVAARLGERLRERERIARELHDTLLQDFQAVILNFRAIAMRLSVGDRNRDSLEQGLDRAEKVFAEGRDRIKDIRADTRAFDDLPDALSRYGNELARTQAMAFTLGVTGSLHEIDPLVRDELYRIAREAIGNAFKHSNGSRVEVEIACLPRELRMRIQDNGRGIDAEILMSGRPGHWGLAGMRERARKIGADLILSSAPEAGTKLELELPLWRLNGRWHAWLRWRWARRWRPSVPRPG